MSDDERAIGELVDRWMDASRRGEPPGVIRINDGYPFGLATP